MIKKRFFRIIAPVTKNKYLLTLALFVVWLSFFDRDNWLDRYHGIKELNALKQEKAKYEQQIIDDKATIKRLDDPDYLEQFAREEHKMKKSNEDIFIVEED